MNAFDWDVTSWPFISALGVLLVDTALRIAALGFIPENRRPSSGMAWALVILLLPIPGFLIWLLLGRTSIGRTRLERQREADEAIRERASAQARITLPAGTPPYLVSAVDLSQELGAFPVVGAPGIDLYVELSDTVEAAVADVDRAEQWVHVEFYILAWDEVTGPLFQALARASARGVDVKVLFDHLATRGLQDYRELTRRLDEHGIAWKPMMPIPPFREISRRIDLRNHRKMLVVDGHTAYMGSHNMTEPGYHKPKNHEAGRRWVDMSCRVQGRLALGLDAVFATDWYVETGQPAHRSITDTPLPAVGGDELPVLGQVLPSGPGVVAENNLRVFTTLVYGAQRRLSLTSPYFVPDESLLYAVTTAAQRGVEVELFVCEEGDQFMVHHAQRSYYQALLEAGVRIYLYPAPLVLHSKHFSVDDEVVVIGSSNMDMRSFALNYEISLVLYGDDVVRQVTAIEDDYRSLSRELTLEQWVGRPWRKRYLDNVMRLTSALQ